LETNQIYDIFDVGGLLDSNLKYYEFREGQLDMSLLIAQTYTNGGVSAIEAGTGIGKSYAYLVPALLHAQENSKERTVIATNTINLQKQLFDKDLTQLENILESGVKSALLMGRSNYLCIRRVQELIKDNSKEAEDINSEIGSLVAWAKKTTTGLRSDYKGYCSAHLWSQVNSDPDFCYGFRCPYNQECFYYNALL
jgi:ATP-dependent DNA helicase DinG